MHQFKERSSTAETNPLKEKITKMFTECAAFLKQRGEDEASFLDEIQKVKIDAGTLKLLSDKKVDSDDAEAILNLQQWRLFSLSKAMASRGSLPSMLRLSDAFKKNKGIPQAEYGSIREEPDRKKFREKQAFKWMKAAAKVNEQAAFTLAGFYENNFGILDVEYEKITEPKKKLSYRREQAFYIYKALAEKDNAVAQLTLARRFFDWDEGIPLKEFPANIAAHAPFPIISDERNEFKLDLAIEWCKKAYDAGLAAAEKDLIRFIQVKHDYPKNDAGNAQAIYRLALLYKEEYHQLSKEKDSSLPAVNVLDSQQKKQHSLKQWYKLIMLAAQSECAEALRSLGDAYQNDRLLINQDENLVKLKNQAEKVAYCKQQAIRYFKAAAKAGDRAATSFLSAILEEQCTQIIAVIDAHADDKDLLISCMEILALQGNVIAGYHLSLGYLQNSTVPKNVSLRIVWDRIQGFLKDFLEIANAVMLFNNPTLLGYQNNATKILAEMNARPLSFAIDKDRKDLYKMLLETLSDESINADIIKLKDDMVLGAGKDRGTYGYLVKIRYGINAAIEHYTKTYPYLFLRIKADIIKAFYSKIKSSHAKLPWTFNTDLLDLDFKKLIFEISSQCFAVGNLARQEFYKSKGLDLKQAIPDSKMMFKTFIQADFERMIERYGHAKIDSEESLFSDLLPVVSYLQDFDTYRKKQLAAKPVNPLDISHVEKFFSNVESPIRDIIISYLGFEPKEVVSEKLQGGKNDPSTLAWQDLCKTRYLLCQELYKDPEPDDTEIETESEPKRKVKKFS